MWDTVWSALTLHAGPLGALAAVLAILAFIFSVFRAVARLWRKPEQVEIVNLPPAPKGQLTVAEFLQIRREMRADLLAELATADPAEAVILRRRVEELERQIADPDPALAAALAEIANLKARLEREANQIGADRVNNFVGVVEDQVRFVEAEEFFRKALEIGRRTIGEEHTDYAIRLNNLAMVVQAQGRFAEAEGLYRQALEIDRATIGAGHPDYATRLNNLAGAVRLQGRYAEAEGLYREALEIGRRTIG